MIELHCAASMVKVGIILGSSRINGNGVGILSYILSLCEVSLAGYLAKCGNEIEFKTLKIPASLGSINSETIPACVKSVEDYASAVVRQWSRDVNECSAFLILTPQHNHGYPGELKTALDHLFVQRVER